jgi:hypothetical protein
MTPARTRERTPANPPEGVRIRSARITPATDVPEEAARRGAQPRLHVALEVENTTDVPLHVWASRRGYDYDPDTHLLVASRRGCK